MYILEKPLVSVIVPVYNVETYIDACLNSITQQTYKNLEIIVVEDCSTDDSRQVIDSHLIDKRIKFIQHSKNQGLSSARNTGIEAATGEYLIFVDSDDIIDIRLIENCLKCAIKTGADLITYGFKAFADGMIDKELPYPVSSLVIEPSKLGNEYFEFQHFAWLKFIRTTALRNSDIRFQAGLYYEDWLFHWHLGLYIDNKYHLPIDFYLYRQRGTSITGSKGKELLDILIAQRQIIALLQDYKGHGLNDTNLLANRFTLTNLYILTVIDSKILSTALSQVKDLDALIKTHGYKSSLTFRNALLSTIVKAPNFTAIPLIQARRVSVHKVFFPALKVRRKALASIAALKTQSK